MPSPARPSTVQKQLDLLQKEEEESRLNSDLLSELELPSSNLSEPNAPKASSSSTKNKDRALTSL